MSPGQIPPSLYFTGVAFLYIFYGILDDFEYNKLNVFANPDKLMEVADINTIKKKFLYKINNYLFHLQIYLDRIRINYFCIN